MKKTSLTILAFVVASVACAQVISTSSGIKAVGVTDNTVSFNLSDAGESKPLEWGLDLAWLDEGNFRRGLLFAGKDLIDVVRVSFRPSHSNMDGTLSQQQDSFLTVRANLVKTYCKSDVTVNINDDHGVVGDVFQCNSYGSSAQNACAAEWAKCIDVHRSAYQAKGITVESVSPINETDYNYHGQISNNESIRLSIFSKICALLVNDYGYLDLGIHLVGGNTLNNDRALEYWNRFKSYLGEGNTHQLAGSFDTYAAFFPQVLAAGQKATNDELHNVMECMVGAEYGLQRGIWWGTCEHTRSQFMKASNKGVRLAYGENRNNWTAASVYRHEDGTVEGFVGASERQARTTKYRFVSKDRDVWYDGQGPMREFVMTVEADPNATYGSDLQYSRENLVNIQDGEDIQPIVNGTYKIASKNNPALVINSNGVLSSYASGASWSVTPFEETLRGDIRYYRIKVANNAAKPIYLDVRDWGLTSGTDVICYTGGFGTNEQWYLRYAEDGCFYIMSRQNAMCLQPKNGSVSSGNTLVVATFNGSNAQKWRFLDTNLTSVSATAPAVASEFAAEGREGSVLLTWNYPVRRGVYQKTNFSANILRRVKGETKWQLLAQGVTALAFSDNTALPGVTYEYALRSRYTNTGIRSTSTTDVIEASVTGDKALLGWWCTGDSLQDATENGNHAAMYGSVSYSDGKIEDTRALTFDGNVFTQLPNTIASRPAMTCAAWVYWNGGNNWQRVFDFGNDETQYIFLTPSNGSQMRFVVKNGGDEQIISTDKMPQRTWTHVACTMDENGDAALYVNGLQIQKKSVGITPEDISPICNYIGRSQFAADPMFNGSVNDLRMYSYALSADEVSALYGGEDPTNVQVIRQMTDRTSDIYDTMYDLSGRRVGGDYDGIIVINGKKIIKK